MVNISNELGLGWWDLANPEYQTAQHMITGPDMNPKPAQILAAPFAGLVPMETITASMVVPAQQTPQYNGNGKGGLIGLPPPIFYRDRSKSEQFLDKLLGYELINGDNKVFMIPYLKVAFCLFYIAGPNIDAWANRKR
jgi:hypothetical protein